MTVGDGSGAFSLVVALGSGDAEDCGSALAAGAALVAAAGGAGGGAGGAGTSGGGGGTETDGAGVGSGLADDVAEGVGVGGVDRSGVEADSVTGPPSRIASEASNQ